MVRVALPLPFATAIAPSEQVAAGVTAGVTLQLRATVEGFSPPTGVIVTVEVTEAPGATESEAGEAASPKSAAIEVVTTKLTTVEELAE
jgi:hypothetical protein